MAEQKKCNLCGARFDVPGAVGTLDEHMDSFHPGRSKSAKPAEDPTPSEAVEALRDAVARIGELEQRLAEARAENEELSAKVAELEGDGSAGNPEAEGSGKKLENMTTAELEAVAAQEGVDLSGASTNAERAAAIAKHRATA